MESLVPSIGYHSGNVELRVDIRLPFVAPSNALNHYINSFINKTIFTIILVYQGNQIRSHRGPETSWDSS